MTSDASVASRARPSGLELKRLEVKYLIDRSRRSGLERDISRLMRLDPHAGPDGSYPIRSLYFDTRNFMAYHEKLAGTAVRHKLRVRVYGDPSSAPVVRLEVKSRYLNFIHKLATDIPRAEYKALEHAFQRRSIPPAHLLETRGAREFFRLQRLYNMEPKILVQYRRRAYERRELRRTRVSFDDQLLASRRLSLLGPLGSSRPLLGCGHCIFEIKVDGGLPWWLHKLIGKYELQNEAISKYCYAVRSEARLSATARSDDEVGGDPVL